MFVRTYQNTIKTLLRTPAFWMMFAVLMVTLAYNNAGEIRSSILSKQPYTADSYYNLINNISVSKLMVYPMPLFAVVTTVLIQNRDYGDQFFEIEKAYAMRPFCYLASRLLALITVSGTLVTLFGFLFLHINVFLHGGVDGFGVWEYLADSFVRVMRVSFLLCIPSLLFFIVLTYASGAVFKSGYAAMVTSTVYVILFYLGQLTLHLRYEPIFQVYFRYLNPLPRALRLYAAMADTDYFKTVFSMYGDKPVHILWGFFCLVFFVCMGIIISFYCVRKRTV